MYFLRAAKVQKGLIRNGGTPTGWRDPDGVEGPRRGGGTPTGWGDPDGVLFYHSIVADAADRQGAGLVFLVTGNHCVAETHGHGLCGA